MQRIIFYVIRHSYIHKEFNSCQLAKCAVVFLTIRRSVVCAYRWPDQKSGLSAVGRCASLSDVGLCAQVAVDKIDKSLALGRVIVSADNRGLRSSARPAAGALGPAAVSPLSGECSVRQNPHSQY